MVLVPGAILAAGTTSSRDFPATPYLLQPVFGGGLTDGFIANINLSTGAIRATYLGGSGDDGINAIAVDSNFKYVAGYTTSTDFPTTNSSQSVNKGGMDGFLAKLNFTHLFLSTYLGGNGADAANALAIDSLSNIIVGGSTGSSDFPVAGSGGSATGSVIASFLTRLSTNFTLAVASAPNFYLDTWHDTGYNSFFTSDVFGASGDIPVIGDWDGTGRKRIGVFRNGTWILDTNGNGVLDATDQVVSFGQAGDVPVLGDWTGSGQIKLGLFRSGTFILDLSGHLSGTPTGLADATFAFGAAGDIPVASDWSHTGITRVGVFRNGQWLVDYSGTHSPTVTYTYGQAGDIPVVGDWDSSGNLKIGVYRNGYWILDLDGDNSIRLGGIYELYIAFGAAGYRPLVF